MTLRQPTRSSPDPVPDPPHAQRKTSRRLSETEKRAIVSLVATGVQINEAAQRFNLNRNTVSRLCKGVREVANSGLSRDWRTKQVPMAVDAVNAALQDRTDVYKAGTIGVTVLKGLGEYKDESNQAGNLNVFVTQINALPEHLKQLFHSDTDVIDCASTPIPPDPAPPTPSSPNDLRE